MMRAEAYLEPVMSIWAQQREETECCISGDCMVPVIRHGDTLVIRHGRDDIRRGDIVVYRDNGKLLVHRLILRERTAAGERLHTKGDRRRLFDPPLRPEQVRGKVIEARGAHGALRFTSGFWRVFNPLLALLSRAAAGPRSPGVHGKSVSKVLRSAVTVGMMTFQYGIAWALCRTCSLPASLRRTPHP